GDVAAQELTEALHHRAVGDPEAAGIRLHLLADASGTGDQAIEIFIPFAEKRLVLPQVEPADDAQTGLIEIATQRGVRGPLGIDEGGSGGDHLLSRISKSRFLGSRGGSRSRLRSVVPALRCQRCRDGDLETVGVDDREVARPPGLVLRRLAEDAAAGGDSLGELVDVLAGGAMEPQADSLLAVTPLGEVVLGEQQLDRTRL